MFGNAQGQLTLWFTEELQFIYLFVGEHSPICLLLSAAPAFTSRFRFSSFFFTFMPFFNKGIILFSYGRSTHFCLFVNILHIKYSTIVHLSLKWNMACNRVSGIKMIRFWGFLYYWVMPIREKLLWDEKCVLCLFLSIFYSVINQ